MMAKSIPKSPVVQDCVYQLHIALEDIEPQIWRRIWIPSNLSLVKLDRVIQTAMGWTSNHLHEFEIAARRYGHINPEWGDDSDLLDERRRSIGTLLTPDISSFIYLYDFGDNWRHKVVVEKVLNPHDGNNWAQCIAGANACPPEDVGGALGYEEFVEAISDPAHDEHVAMRRWNGGPFDSQGFDINEVNRELRRLRL